MDAHGSHHFWMPSNTLAPRELSVCSFLSLSPGSSGRPLRHPYLTSEHSHQRGEVTFPSCWSASRKQPSNAQSPRLSPSPFQDVHVPAPAPLFLRRLSHTLPVLLPLEAPGAACPFLSAGPCGANLSPVGLNSFSYRMGVRLQSPWFTFYGP